MFRVKICGITRLEDARVAADAGADAIGLNFYALSPRCCPLEPAREIAQSLPRHVCKVGVFVNASADEIHRTAESVPLDLVQLHGDEPPELMREIRPLPIMRAVRVRDDLSEIGAFLAACHRQAATPRLLLVDAWGSGQYGGTGATVDWTFLAQNRQHFRGLPLVLAGGLTAENVSAAIATVRPWAVDVASGVEIAPGRKSPELVRRFVCAARMAFRELTTRT
ncbi:MAG: phosphoribosylanthranilate isomerase [Pirellulales bacterium]